jgi:signal transduction histidine kinase
VLFIAIYLFSNLLFPWLAKRPRWTIGFDLMVVLFDVLAASIGLMLTRQTGTDFIPLYFLIIFVAALTARVHVAVGAAVLISLIHLATLSQTVSARHLLMDGYLIRVPFLFAVALFFSSVVARVRHRERVTRARQREQRRAEVLSTITHDIKSPLANVQSMAEMLLGGDAGDLSAAQLNLVRRMHSSVRHVLQLSVNLLDAARIDAGRLGFWPRIAQIANVVDDAVALMRSAAMVKGIDLEYACDKDLPLTVFDALQMERVIANLLDNAIKYTPAGGLVKVRVRKEQGAVAIEVRDNGPGLAPEDIPHLFDKFRRHKHSSAVQGSGLGLFIVKAIVEAHGGTVTMSSTPGAGVSVVVSLPRLERSVLQPMQPNVVLQPSLRVAVSG